MTNSPAERFWALPRIGSPDRKAADEFSEIAAAWRHQGHDLGAAYAMERAAMAAWGDPELMGSCAIAAKEDYERYLARADACSLGVLVALKKSAQLAWSPAGFRFDPTVSADEMLQVLADRLIACGEASEHAVSYLVRGLTIETDLQEHFVPSFPDYEVDWHGEASGGGYVQVKVPSAFQLLVEAADYYGAHRIATQNPDAFTTPVLAGWRAAVWGFAQPEEAAERFQEAAEAFSKDEQPDFSAPGFDGRPSWSSINIDLWAPYFSSRASLSMAIREPESVRQFVDAARAAAPEIRSGWHNPTVSRYVILVRALAHLLQDASPEGLQEARKSLIGEQRLSGDQPGDHLMSRFLAVAAEAFEGFQTDPGQEIMSGRLPDALSILGRIPIVEPGFADAIRPALGTQAISAAHGPIRAQLYRTLEAISDEKQLQQIVLRLARASLPAYAQILHGPSEYGKDVAVLLEHKGQRVLRMFQVKAGDISMRNWRDARQQLEEMFQVPLSNFMLGGKPPDIREGVLVCNGHPLPHVVQPMEGWFEEQRRDHGRQVSFMHLDDFVHWVHNDRLVNELRAVLEELGLETGV